MPEIISSVSRRAVWMISERSVATARRTTGNRRRRAYVGNQPRPLSHVRATLDTNVGQRELGRVEAQAPSFAPAVRCFLARQSIPPAAFVERPMVAGYRKPVSEDNPFWQAQQQMSDWITNSLDAYRDARDSAIEAWFHGFYGSPLVQSLLGLRASDGSPRQRPGDDPTHRMLVVQRTEELKKKTPMAALERPLCERFFISACRTASWTRAGSISYGVCAKRPGKV